MAEAIGHARGSQTERRHEASEHHRRSGTAEQVWDGAAEEIESGQRRRIDQILLRVFPEREKLVREHPWHDRDQPRVHDRVDREGVEERAIAKLPDDDDENSGRQQHPERSIGGHAPRAGVWPADGATADFVDSRTRAAPEHSGVPATSMLTNGMSATKKETMESQR